MTDSSWTAAKRAVYVRAQGRCEYCQTCEDNTGQAMHVEHIDPAGGDDVNNLCLACPTCNLSKATATTALDPETEQLVSLFNPRSDIWGTSLVGRATVTRLKMNQDRVVRARHNWIAAGTHPPD